MVKSVIETWIGDINWGVGGITNLADLGPGSEQTNQYSAQEECLL